MSNPNVIIIFSFLNEIRTNYHKLCVFKDTISVFCIVELKQDDFKFTESTLFFVCNEILDWYMGFFWTQIT